MSLKFLNPLMLVYGLITHKLIFIGWMAHIKTLFIIKYLILNIDGKIYNNKY